MATKMHSMTSDITLAFALWAF